MEIFHTVEFASFLSLLYVPLRDLIGGKIPVQVIMIYETHILYRIIMLIMYLLM